MIHTAEATEDSQSSSLLHFFHPHSTPYKRYLVYTGTGCSRLVNHLAQIALVGASLVRRISMRLDHAARLQPIFVG